jgi:hypothetical protein
LLRNLAKYFLLLSLLLANETAAQYLFFGRNKVQYEKFDWKVLKTTHFDIYYYDDFGEMAEIGAGYAEEAFDEFKVKFDEIVNRRIPLIFYNTHSHFQQTNTTPCFIPEGVGGFFEFNKGRVVIPYLGSLEQFRHVIRHELVHVFTVEKILRSMEDHRLPERGYPPLWFVEGLAEYWSTKWDNQAEMLLRDAVPNGYYASLKNIDAIMGSFLMYKEGQKFMEFVSQEYGEDKILVILNNFWRFRKFNDLMEFVFGETIDMIDSKWDYFLKQKYFSLYKDKYPHFINSKKLTDFGFNFDPSFYDDGERKSVYFVGNHNGYSSIYRLTYDLNAADFIKPELILEGEKEDIFETFHLLTAALSVSKKGIIAFVTKSGAADVLHLYSIAEKEVINTLKFDELLTINSPKFSPDGNLIVFSGTDRKGYVDLFVYDLNNNKLSRITNDYFSDKDPVFNKDGSKIVFSSDRTTGKYKQVFNLFEIDLNSRDISYLSYCSANAMTPHFNTDYTRLFFTSDYDGVPNIWELDYKNGMPEGMTQKSFFLTSVFDFDFSDPNTVITSAFEKYSCQFYAFDVSKRPDSTDTKILFNFENTGEKWSAVRIAVNSQKDKIKYEREYALDYAVSQFTVDPVYGNRGGAMFQVSDLMGDDQYFLTYYNNAEIESSLLDNVNVSLARYHFGGRTNYAYGIFNYSGRRYDLMEQDDYFYERAFGGFMEIIYPLSKFQRLEAGVSIANTNREVLGDVVTRKGFLVTNTLSFVHDNSLWSPTGPLDGSRLRILLGYTSDIKYSNTNYYSIIADYRYYLRLGLWSTLAFRNSLYFNDGKYARRYIGGGSWDLRGWDRFSLRGEKLWVSSVELRFPLVDQLYIKLPFVGISLPYFRGALFFDAGGVWDKIYSKTLGSVGFGFRFNLFGAIVFRYDMGKKIEQNFTKLQHGMFYQFFFGVDF